VGVVCKELSDCRVTEQKIPRDYSRLHNILEELGDFQATRASLFLKHKLLFLYITPIGIYQSLLRIT
jgi:hypothetical protein